MSRLNEYNDYYIIEVIDSKYSTRENRALNAFSRVIILLNTLFLAFSRCFHSHVIYFEINV